MSKEDKIEFEGEVVDVLPNALFRIKADNGMSVLATLSGKMRTNNINVLINDRVVVEVSPYDLTRGRIKYRRK